MFGIHTPNFLVLNWFLGDCTTILQGISFKYFSFLENVLLSPLPLLVLVEPVLDLWFFFPQSYIVQLWYFDIITNQNQYRCHSTWKWCYQDDETIFWDLIISQCPKYFLHHLLLPHSLLNLEYRKMSVEFFDMGFGLVLRNFHVQVQKIGTIVWVIFLHMHYTTSYKVSQFWLLENVALPCSCMPFMFMWQIFSVDDSLWASSPYLPNIHKAWSHS